MSNRIVVSVDPYEARAAKMEGDRLVNIEVESAAQEKRKGSIYRGKVMAVEQSFEAAFVNYGTGKEGFLPFDEVCTRSLVELTGHGRSQKGAGVRVGDTILVQVTKEEVGKKGATLSMHVSLPGRYVVLMPFDDRTGVSRKLDPDERNRLRKELHRLGLPEGFGVIIRTSGESTDRREDLQLDLDHLLKSWEQVLEKFRSAKEPGEIRADAGLAVRFIRDYLSSDVDEIQVEDEYSMRELERYMDSCMPGRRPILKRYLDEIPLFIRYGVERQVEALLRRRVHLPSGGSIVIGETEALVAIDVNSGRLKRRGIENTAFQANIEAAREIARQMVLRDLGGIIVVDFIDMESDANRRKVTEELKAAMSKDKARLTFGQITDFGLLAFSRQRIRQTVDSGFNLACPTCSGSGRIRSPSALAMSALRNVREKLATQAKRAAYVEVVVPVRVANFLNNRKREALVGLEKHHSVLLDVTGDADAQPDEIRVNVLPEVPPDRSAMIRAEEEPVEEPSPPPPPPPPKSEESHTDRGGFKNFLRMVLGIPETPQTPVPDGAGSPEPKTTASTGSPAQPDVTSPEVRDSSPSRPPRRRGNRGRGRRRPTTEQASSEAARKAPSRQTPPETKSDPKPGPQARQQPGSGARPRTKPQARPVSNSASKPRAAAKRVEKPVLTAEMDPKVATTPVNKDGSSATPKPKPKPKPGSRSRSRSRRGQGTEPRPKTDSGTQTRSEPERGSDSKPVPDSSQEKSAEQKKTGQGSGRSGARQRSRRRRPNRSTTARGNDAGPEGSAGKPE